MITGENSVKIAAASGRRIRGVHITFAAPAAVELLASFKLDFLYIDGEHGCFDWRDIEIACITAERHRMTPIARIPDRSTGTITRFLDRGVRGIVVPHVESVADAEEVIAATYFSPLGGRSFGSGRPDFGMNGIEPSAYLAQCNANVSLCIMIESAAALKNAGDLAALDGVDYLSFGLNDLAQSLSLPGDAAVRAAVSEASQRIHAKNKRVREDFMSFAWINDLLRAGVKQLLPV